MAALLVALAVMAVTITVAMPVWQTAAKREREEELVWRGTQYARAVALFRRKYANASPPNLDILLNERFLRKKYKDPVSKDGEFQLVYAADQEQRAGETQPKAPPSRLDQGQRSSAGARGGIIGVISKSTDRSLRVFNGRTKYNEWSFTPETVGLRGAGGQGGPSAPVPGGAPGSIGPGGRPAGPGGASPGSLNFDRLGRPGSPAPPTRPPQPRPFGLPTSERPPG